MLSRCLATATLYCMTAVLGFITPPYHNLIRPRINHSNSAIRRQRCWLCERQSSLKPHLQNFHIEERREHKSWTTNHEFDTTQLCTVRSTDSRAGFSCEASFIQLEVDDGYEFAIELHANSEYSTQGDTDSIDRIASVFHRLFLKYLTLEQLVYQDERDGNLCKVELHLAGDSNILEVIGIGQDSFTGNDKLGFDLEEYVPFMNDFIVRHRGTDQGNTALDVQRMLCQRRVPYDFQPNKDPSDEDLLTSKFERAFQREQRRGRVPHDGDLSTVSLQKDVLPTSAVDKAMDIINEIKARQLLSMNPDSVDGLPSLHLNLISNGKPMFDKAESDFAQMITRLTAIIEPHLYNDLLPAVQMLLNSPTMEISDVFIRNYGHIQDTEEDDAHLPTRYTLSPHYDITACATCVVTLDSTASTGKNGLYTVPRSVNGSTNNAALRRFFPLKKGDGVVHTFDVLHGVDVDPGLNMSRTSLIIWFGNGDKNSTQHSWLDDRKDDISEFVSGLVLEEDDKLKEAIDMYISSAAQGNIFAMTALAQLCLEDKVPDSEYERIKGLIPSNAFHPKEVTESSSQDLANTLWYHAAIQGGNPVAQNSLARSVMSQYALTESELSRQEQEQQLLMASTLFTMAYNNRHQDSLDALNMMMRTQCQRLHEMGVQIPSEHFFSSPVVKVLRLSLDRQDSDEL